MHFRNFILDMTLDIEHYLKTQLLRDISENDKEDGYSIIETFFLKYSYIKENIEKKGKNSVCFDLISKYKENFAVWNIVEILSFGDFTKLYSLYYRKYKNEASLENFLWAVRLLRNAAAHNNCLLNNLRNPYAKKIRPYRKLISVVAQIDGISREVRREKMKNPLIHDFVATLFVFCNIVASKGIKEKRMEALKELVEGRMVKRKEYFQENQLIVSYYNFLKKAVDFFYNLCL